jgi:hypothetical protein
MMTPTPATAERTPFGEFSLTFPYAGSEDLRDALKQQIPARFRRWEPDGKRWLVMGAYAPQAIDLLLQHFPHAEVPDDTPRRITRTPARTVRPPARSPGLDADAGAVVVTPDDAPPSPFLAVVRCPRCRAHHEQPVRVVAESAERVARRETITPELLMTCPACQGLIVVGFWPALTVAS